MRTGRKRKTSRDGEVFGLLPKAQLLHDRPVLLYIASVEIAQQPAALPHEREETTSGNLVFFVPAKMLGYLVDPVR